MSALAPIAPRLGQLVRMLASPVDGEALAAARALGRTLERAGATFHDLAERVERADQSPAAQSSGAPRRRAPAGRRARVRQTAPHWAKLSPNRRGAWLSAASNCIALTAWEWRLIKSLRAQVVSYPDRPLSPKQVAAVDGILAKVWAAGARP